MNVNEIIGCFAYDEEIAKSLLCTDKNYRDYIIKEGDMDSLAWNYIFPYTRNPKTNEIANSFITMHFKQVPTSSSDKFKMAQIKIFVICHESLVRTEYGDLRYNLIAERIENVIHGQWFSKNVGKMKSGSREDFSVSNESTDYYGTELTYINVAYS